MKSLLIRTFLIICLTTYQAFADDAIKASGIIVDFKQKSQITIHHQPIPALEWDEMTMDFKVENHVNMQDLHKGDKILFELTPIEDDFIISKITK